VPSLELAIALAFAKFYELPWSDGHQYMAASDIVSMANKNRRIDLTRLESLGDLVRSGHGKRIVAKVRALQEGKEVRW
jgi:hypothetical protein